MTMKESLAAAVAEAKDLSVKNPGTVYRIFKKSRNGAKVLSVDWLCVAAVRDGWSFYDSYRNGKAVGI